MTTRNILIGKIGKAMSFTTTDISVGGGNDVILFSTIARMHPEWMLWIVGPNNLDKIVGTEQYDVMFPAHNCKSLFGRDKSLGDDLHKPIFDNIRKEGLDGKIDCALFFSGMAAQRNIPGFTKKADGSEYSILNSYKYYVAPYLQVLNETNVPFYCIAEDARYITINAKDLCNRERLIFTQFEGNIYTDYPHILSIDDINTMEKTQHRCIYADIEKIPLMGVPFNWRDGIDVERKVNSPINKRFFVLSNGCGTSRINHSGNNSSRLPVYKEWVHDATVGTPYEGAKVYGSWDKNIYEENPWIEKRFIVDMAEDIADCRYSLVYSQVRGFVTAKAYELICLGIIPFIHHDYDPNRFLGLPEYLYVNTPQEMIEKMQQLDNDETLYRNILRRCMNVIKQTWQDGSMIINNMFDYISKDLGWDEYRPADGVEPIFQHFSKNVFNVDDKNSFNLFNVDKKKEPQQMTLF